MKKHFYNRQLNWKKFKRSLIEEHLFRHHLWKNRKHSRVYQETEKPPNQFWYNLHKSKFWELTKQNNNHILKTHHIMLDALPNCRANRAWHSSKLSYNYFLTSTNQLAVRCTDCSTANRILTECCISIIGKFQYIRW